MFDDDKEYMDFLKELLGQNGFIYDTDAGYFVTEDKLLDDDFYDHNTQQNTHEDCEFIKKEFLKPADEVTEAELNHNIDLAAKSNNWELVDEFLDIKLQSA